MQKQTQKRRHRIFTVLVIVAVGAISYFLIMYFVNQYKAYRFVIENRPYVLMIPTKSIIREPKTYPNFIRYDFKNLSVYLPPILKKQKEKGNSVVFSDSNRQISLFLSRREEELIPKELKGKYRNTFEFFKDVLYSKFNPLLLNYKTSIIPYMGKKIDITEVEIGENKGFLYKGKFNDTMRYVFDLFFDKVHITMNIMVKDDFLTEEEIYYIISTLKVEE
jgi:hypothetical protein